MSCAVRKPFIFLITAFALVSALSACGKETEKMSIVALGDSYASGEGLVPYTSQSSTGANQCHDSISSAYAVLAAKALKADVDNRACSGATTQTMVEGKGDAAAPQLTNLSDADIVTVTIGGNDIQALSSLVQIPDAATFAQRVSSLEPTLVDTYQKIKQAAPKARVIVVGYPSVVPATANDQCLIKPAQLPVLRAAQGQLNETVAGAAETAHVEYVDLTQPFADHELCSAQPWVNGLDFANFSASLHPNQQGQQAIADALVSQIKTKAPR